MRMRSKQRLGEWIKVIGVCLVCFMLVVFGMWFKLQAYGGDPDCLFVKCVKVIK